MNGDSGFLPLRLCINCKRGHTSRSSPVADLRGNVFCCLDCAWSYTILIACSIASVPAAAAPLPGSVNTPGPVNTVTTPPRRPASPGSPVIGVTGGPDCSEPGVSSPAVGASVAHGAVMTASGQERAASPKVSSFRPPRPPGMRRKHCGLVDLDRRRSMGTPGRFAKGRAQQPAASMDSSRTSSSPSSHALLDFLGFGDPI
jgi:hypothetical protein